MHVSKIRNKRWYSMGRGRQWTRMLHYSEVAFKLKFRICASAEAYKLPGICNAFVVPERLNTMKYLLNSHRTCNYVCELCSN